MQVNNYQPLTQEIREHLNRGSTLICDANQEIRSATVAERVIRWFHWGHARQQDQAVIERLIQQLMVAQSQEGYQDDFCAISRYMNLCSRANRTAHRRLENMVFAHKCHQQLHGIRVRDLVDGRGAITNEQLFNLIKRNHLQYVIRKANKETRDTAFLFGSGNTVYIRTKAGESFLDTHEHINLILARLPEEHPHREWLTELGELLNENDLNTQQVERMETLRLELASGHYHYQSIADLRLNQRGFLVSQNYLADGIEDFDREKWRNVQPNFREKLEIEQNPGYKLRIVTRQPRYAIQNSWLKGLWFFFVIDKAWMDFRGHGHTWIELVEPAVFQDGQGRQNVYNVGYYFHPFKSRCNFKSADPMAYMPINPRYMLVEEIDIEQNQFEDGQLYLKEVQARLQQSHGNTDFISTIDRNSKPDHVKQIDRLYNGAVKSTCIAFANMFKQALTAVENDDRSPIQRLICPKSCFFTLDGLDNKFIRRTFILRHIFKVLEFINRMEVPFFARGRGTPPPESSTANVSGFFS